MSLALPTDEPGVDGPPIGIMVLGGILGLVTVAAVVRAWRTGSRRAIRLVAGLRVFSVITALPAFFVDGVAVWIKVLVALGVLVTAASVVLMLSPAARRGPVLD